MAISFVKVTTGYDAGNTNFSLSVSATTGNLLVVCTGYANSPQTLTVSDGVNTYTSVTSASQSTYAACISWYAQNITGGSLTLSFTSGLTVCWPVIVAEFSGVATSSALEATANGTAGSGTEIDSGSLSSSASSGDLVVAFACNYYSATAWAGGSTAPSGMTVPTGGTNDNGDGAGNTGLGYSILSSGYSSGVGLAPTTSTVYGSIVVGAFKAASGTVAARQFLSLLGVGS